MEIKWRMMSEVKPDYDTDVFIKYDGNIECVAYVLRCNVYKAFDDSLEDVLTGEIYYSNSFERIKWVYTSELK